MAKTPNKANLVIWLIVLLGIGLMVMLHIINGMGALAGEPLMPPDAPALTVRAEAKPDPAGYILVAWSRDEKDEAGSAVVQEYAICRKTVGQTGGFTIVGYSPRGSIMYVDSNNSNARAKLPPSAYLEDGKEYLYQVRTIFGSKPVPLGNISSRYPDPKSGNFYLSWDELAGMVNMDRFYAIKLLWYNPAETDANKAWVDIPDAQFPNSATGAVVNLGDAAVPDEPVTFQVVGLEPIAAPNISRDMETPVAAVIPAPLSTMPANVPDSDGGKIDVALLPSDSDALGGGDVWEYAIYRAPYDEKSKAPGEMELLDFVSSGTPVYNDYSNPDLEYKVPDNKPMVYRQRAYDFSSTAKLVGQLPPVTAKENRLIVDLSKLPGYMEAAEADNFLCFELERSNDGIQYGRLTTMQSALTSFIDVKVTAGKTYYYRVRALSKDLGDAREVALIKELKPEKMPPDDKYGVAVAWDKEAGFTSLASEPNIYKLKLERAEWGKDAKFSTIAYLPPKASQYVDQSVEIDKDKVYQYRLEALILPKPVTLLETPAMVATPEGISITWAPQMGDSRNLQVERANTTGDIKWQVIDTVPAGTAGYTDSMENGMIVGQAYHYRVSTIPVYQDGEFSPPVSASPTWFKMSTLPVLIAILSVSILILFYISLARRGTSLFIRRIAGLEAVQEAVGRATEMGKSILYVPGISSVGDIQTIASLVILGRVARMVADYESNIIVPCNDPLVMSVAQETIKEAFSEAGRPDSYRSDSVRFITSEQFAYVAGVDGIMLRDKPAATFFLGTFYAESLILAETGHSIGAIQIAGTAMPSQIPFFVVACDYTMIGEELYAASSYLSREPRLMGSLLGQDWGKVIAIIIILLLSTAVSIGHIMGIKPSPPNVQPDDYYRSFTPAEKLAWTLNHSNTLIRPAE